MLGNNKQRNYNMEANYDKHAWFIVKKNTLQIYVGEKSKQRALSGVFSKRTYVNDVYFSIRILAPYAKYFVISW